MIETERAEGMKGRRKAELDEQGFAVFCPRLQIMNQIDTILTFVRSCCHITFCSVIPPSPVYWLLSGLTMSTRSVGPTWLAWSIFFLFFHILPWWKGIWFACIWPPHDWYAYFSSGPPVPCLLCNFFHSSFFFGCWFVKQDLMTPFLVYCMVALPCFTV